VRETGIGVLVVNGPEVCAKELVAQAAKKTPAARKLVSCFIVNT
jgi:hypothetical protein